MFREIGLISIPIIERIIEDKGIIFECNLDV